MLFRLRKETAFKFILLQTICFSCVTLSFSPRNLTTGLGLEAERGTETVDHRRWKRFVKDVWNSFKTSVETAAKKLFCNDEEIHSVVTFPGESVRLQCSSCGKTDFQVSVWRIQLTGAKEPVKLSSLGRGEVRREGAVDLAITNISPELKGMYTCISINPRGIYEIIVRTLPEFEVVFGQPPSEDKRREGSIVTSWGEWTTCSAAKCGTLGERSRIGWCSYLVRRKLLLVGVPCMSSQVPKSEGKRLKNIPDKKLIQACRLECSEDSRFTPLSSNMPELPPTVRQKALYTKAGESVTLSCSGVSVVAYARWEVDGTMIRHVDLQREGDKHLTIDAFNTLHINGLRDSDEGIYGCWHNDVLHHSYKLKIVKPPPNTKEAEGGALWVGIVLTFIVLAVIAIGVIKAYLMKRKVVK